MLIISQANTFDSRISVAPSQQQNSQIKPSCNECESSKWRDRANECRSSERKPIERTAEQDDSRNPGPGDALKAASLPGFCPSPQSDNRNRVHQVVEHGGFPDSGASGLGQALFQGMGAKGTQDNPYGGEDCAQGKNQ